jgi:oxygen-independent coproporphyrinogen-3 oxidase
MDQAARAVSGWGVDRQAANGLGRSPFRYYGNYLYPALASSTPGMAGIQVEEPKSARIYIHLPFCTQRCTFCHFGVSTSVNDATMTRYVDLLLTEARALKARFPNVQVENYFIGGGTPSLTPIGKMDEILGEITGLFGTPDHGFNAVEVHPQLVHQEGAEDWLKLLTSYRFKRVSVGLQAVQQDQLDSMKRRHDVDEAVALVNMARRAGFDFFNVDLMYGLPGQTLEHWAETLEFAGGLPVDSLSTYPVAVRPMSEMNGLDKDADFPSGSENLAMSYLADVYLKTQGYEVGLRDYYYKTPAGFEHYADDSDGEMDAGAGIWNTLPLGMTAWGQIGDQIIWNGLTWGDYGAAVTENGLGWSHSVKLGATERFRRDVILSLRNGGMDMGVLNKRFDIDCRTVFAPQFDLMERLGLADFDGDQVSLTTAGGVIRDEVSMLFYSQSSMAALTAAERGAAEPIKVRYSYTTLPPHPSKPLNVLSVIASPNLDGGVRQAAAAFQAGAQSGGHNLVVRDLYFADGAPRDLGAATPGLFDAIRDEAAAADILALFFPVYWFGFPAELRRWLEGALVRGGGLQEAEDGALIGAMQAKRAIFWAHAMDEAAVSAEWAPALEQANIIQPFGFCELGGYRFDLQSGANAASVFEQSQRNEKAAFLGRWASAPDLYKPLDGLI